MKLVEKMKQVEGMFFNAMDVLRPHKNTKWSEVKTDNKPSISDINSWKDENFYCDGRTKNDRGGSFITISDFIATYQDHEQTLFNVLAHHDIDATPLDIEKSILQNALLIVGDDEDDEMGSIYDLAKLSSCTHWVDKYEEKERLKIETFTDRLGGKWYFQPDQRCVVVQQFIDEDPRIARDVLPFKEWLEKSCGEKDPDQWWYNNDLRKLLRNEDRFTSFFKDEPNRKLFNSSYSIAMEKTEEVA